MLCFYCPQEATTQDHVIPLSRGGRNIPTNKVPCCALCNTTKGNTHPEDWMEFLKFLHEEGVWLHEVSRSKRKMLKYKFRVKTGITVGVTEELQSITLSREERLKAMELLNETRN